ncbi:Hypothetical protein, putative [Bodo saltans]|uniref:Uncharacterized protein n=1 Tax=Bodo saltans TaxID=75058 RepID=A0A0S4JET8_BODSA|nr:Hypothetical protein, putative [Bodo saltans]|eukprot:CUG90104.1 Hypothetical protein, putative [Bodo saltans]
MRRASTVRILDDVHTAKVGGSTVKPSTTAATSSPTSLGAFFNSGTFGTDGHEDSSASWSPQRRRSVALIHESQSPTAVPAPTALPSSSSSSALIRTSSRPKPSVGQRVEVNDVSALVSLVAQRHAVIKDRDKLLALSDVASLLLTEGPLLPRARDNIALSNKREVLMEELAEHRINVQSLQHLANVANEEHERLLTVNDSLLAMVKRKDDLHAQTTQQFYIAGTMDAEANETLMKLEGRRRTLLGFASAMKRDVERIIGGEEVGGGPSKTTSPHGKNNKLKETLMKLEGRRRTLLGFASAMKRDVERIIGGEEVGGGPSKTTSPHGKNNKLGKTLLKKTVSPPPSAAEQHHNVSAAILAGGLTAKLRPTMHGDGWTTTVDDNGNRKKLAPSSRLSQDVAPKTPLLQNAPSSSKKQNDGGEKNQQQRGGKDDVERRLFELRLSGHELLSQLEVVITNALDCGSDVVGGVEGAMRTAQELRAVLTDPTDGRGSLWLFSSCTKPTCLVSREKLRKLLPTSATTMSKSPSRRSP